MTRREAAIVSAYTGIMCGSFSDFAEYAESLMERPISTIEYPGLMEEIKELSRPDFLKMCAEIDG